MSYAKIERLFHKGCVEYDMLQDGDRVLVALSGGKDSLMLLRLLAAQSKLYKPRVEVEAAHVVMDNIPYETDSAFLQEYCDVQGVRLHILHSSFDETKDGRKTKCFLCSWNRRKTLFTFASDNAFNKLALGHHQDDIIVTLLMNQMFEGSIQTMPPRLTMRHYPVTIIRPLCLVPEYMIEEEARRLAFARQKRPCPYETVTHRETVTRLFRQMEQINPEARYSLWHSMKNIHTDLLP